VQQQQVQQVRQQQEQQQEQLQQELEQQQELQELELLFLPQAAKEIANKEAINSDFFIFISLKD